MVSQGPGLTAPVTINVLRGAELMDRMPDLINYALAGEFAPPSRHPVWLYILKDGLGHVPFAIEARRGSQTCGMLALAYIRSTLFGKYLVSLPYLNSGGVLGDNHEIRQELIEYAVDLSRELRVKHLELRHEQPVEHPLFNGRRDNKVHMRLALPSFPGPLWTELPAKVRNQVRKGEKSGLTVHWGRTELLHEFYEVFSTNMRDLGTPVYSPRLFAAMLRYFGPDCEICVLRLESKPISAAICIHGKGVTDVPSASALREYNAMNANMMMYWNLIDRAIQRGQSVFDFGRSSIDSNTFKFKRQWGALPEPAVWQYHLRGRARADLRPDNPRYQKLIRLWQKLPVPLTRWIGPPIVRGIP